MYNRLIWSIKEIITYQKSTTIQKNLQQNAYRSFKENKLTKFNGKENKTKNIALDGIGFTNDHANKYYAIICKKEKVTLKKNITINIKFV